MRVCHRQRIEQDSFCYGKDRRIRTDSQGQRSNGYACQDGISLQLAQAKEQIPRQGGEDGKRALFVVAFSQQSGIPKLPTCRRFGIPGLHAPKNEAFFQHLDVELNLVFQFRIHPLATK
jgi:hypothetical protein